jgi:hypothetical protein
MNAALDPVRQRRAEITSKPGFVRDVLESGSEKARHLADATMEKVARAMSLL